ncbi:unnamed protein product [Symbiodinium sp. CCMP2592]|nr:unnamed protein product [Symbiodinium sp. CCMP2592]
MTASKWRLNKTEEKTCEEHGKAAEAASIAAGKSKQEAKSDRETAKNQMAQEIKEAKAKRAAAKAGPRSTPAAAAPAPADPSAAVVVTPSPCHNTGYYTAVINARDEILKHPIFRNMISEAPMKISDAVAAHECGVQSVFDAADCSTALKAQGVYRAAVNMFWVDMMLSATPNVPLNLSRTKSFSDQFFRKGPAHLRNPIVIAVAGADAEVDRMKGSWQMISPEEMVHSVMLFVAGRINEGAEDSELQQWKAILLSTPAQFEIVSGEDAIYWAAYEARQQITQAHDSMKRTARQMCHEVVGFKNRKEAAIGTPLKHKELQDLYKSRPNATSTEIADGFIASALKVYDRMLNIPEVNSVLDELEARHGLASCFNSMDKLKIVAEKCDSKEQKIWVMQGILDLLKQGSTVLRNEGVTQAWLSGSATSASAVEVLKFRKSCAEYFVEFHLPKCGFGVEDLSSLKRKMFTHEDYRKFVTPMAADALPDNTWQAQFAKSSLLLMKLLEDVLYGTALNSALVTCVKKGQRVSPLELVELETFAVRLKACVEQRENEVQAERALVGEETKAAAEETEESQLASGKKAPVPSNYQRGSPEHWVATAAQQLNVYIKLIAEPDTQAGIEKAIVESPLSKSSIEGAVGKNMVMLHIDADLLGESAKRPGYRAPSIPPDIINKLVYGALRGRGARPVGSAAEPDVPISGDALVVCDAGRCPSTMLAPFKQHSKRAGLSHYIEHAEIVLALAQDSVKEKRAKNRGSIAQVMRWHILSQDPLAKMVPERKFDNFPGTNRGTIIGFIGGLSKPPDTWMSTVENKKVVYGNHIFGSDASAMDDDDGPEDVARAAQQMEPVFFNFLPRLLYENFLKANNVIGVLDLSPGQGELCRAALDRRIPYLGICMTEAHSLQLKTEMVNHLKTQMATEGSSFYSAEWAEIAGKSKTTAPKNEKPDPAPKKTKKEDDKNDKKKKKGGKRKLLPSSSSSSSSSESSEKPRKAKKTK